MAAQRYLPNLATRHTKAPTVTNIKLGKPYTNPLNLSVERLGPSTSRNAMSRYAQYQAGTSMANKSFDLEP